jgi:hypothetical protein
LFAFGLLCLAMRYPFTDVVMYTAPLAVAVVAWLSATVINVSCGSVACKVSDFEIDCESYAMRFDITGKLMFSSITII